MQLRSLFTSSAQPIKYTLAMLADDLRTGEVPKLIVQEPYNGLDMEIRTSNNEQFQLLREVLQDNPIQYVPKYDDLVNMVLNELHYHHDPIK
jgi:hypothetical protein